MTETLFTLDDGNSRDGQEGYCGACDNDSFRRDIDVRSERKVVGCVSVIKQRSRSNLHFRRTWRDILDGPTDLIMWFPKYGMMSFSDYRGSVTIGPGEFVLTRSTIPFSAACQVDAEPFHEVVYVIVPADEIRTYFSHDFAQGIFRPDKRPEFGLAAGLFANIIEHGSLLSDDALNLLLVSALRIIGLAVERTTAMQSPRVSVPHRRIEEIFRCIEVRLSDASLSQPSVAKACGISPRYLTSLLKSQGTNFTKLVWHLRLEKAKSWLADSDPRAISIAEIAFGLGFKSPCHFSRLFKQVYRARPRDFRRPVSNELGRAKEYQRSA